MLYLDINNLQYFFIISFVFCLCLSFGSIWKEKSQNIKQKAEIKNLQDFQTYQYYDHVDKDGNETKHILVSVNLKGANDIESTLTLIREAYISHPWFICGLHHNFFVIAKYTHLISKGKLRGSIKIGEGEIHIRGCNKTRLNYIFTVFLNFFCKSCQIQGQKLDKLHTIIIVIQKV